MPLTVSFRLCDKDLEYFRKLIRSARANASTRDDPEIVGAARRVLEEVRRRGAADFVHHRLEKLETLARMLEEEEWRLAGADRDRLLDAMPYFV